MFSFRRRPKDTSAAVPPLRSSPSLPQLHAQDIPWPENLVDVPALRETPASDDDDDAQTTPRAATPVVKPRQQGHAAPNGATISSMYMSHPPSAFDSWRSATPTSGMSAPNRRTHGRKNRSLPAFNVMVVGGRGTGKTSLLRLLLETSDISPTATTEQRAALHRFLQGGLERTQSINTAHVEISESRYDRVLLTVIDTPGLDFSVGGELSVERQVTTLIRYIDQQYADTMIEESKVIRQSKGDQHIHLCMFMVDPSFIVNPNARRAKLSTTQKSYSDTTPSPSQDVSEEMTISPGELRVIRRLSERVNVLPVIARADSLTDDTLAAVKVAVRKGLRNVGLDFGVFATPISRDSDSAAGLSREITANGSGAHGVTANGTSADHPNGNSHAGPTNKERTSRPVVGRAPLSRERSRSRRDLSAVAHDEREPFSPEDADEQSVANVRFSAQALAKVELGELLPFAFIAPEPLSSPREMQACPVTPDSSTSPGKDPISASTPSPDSPITRRSVYQHTPPEDLRGVFTRKFRWGTVDVLNPDHCDFAALRTAMLLTHMKVLKVHTREVLYEKYRTEKLLAKRATRAIGPEETIRLLEDLGF